ncbi:sodium:calcium antiporter [archaeon]|jgi:cation:H+ antiporter|nr:sodium:calcium antiporter [archaeon]
MVIWNLIFGISFMVICSYIIAKACDLFEASTEYLGRNMEDGIKGATLNAIGSSIPEFLTTVFFLVFATSQNLGRDFAASVGGDTGSAIFNTIAIPGLVLLVTFFVIKGVSKVKISKKVILRDGLFLIGAEILLLILLSSDYLTHWHGWVFTGFYAIYLAYLIYSHKKARSKSSKEESLFEPNAWYEKFIHSKRDGRGKRATWLLILAVVILSLCAAGLVEGTKIVSTSIGINPIFIALILVAAATSVPDLIISLKDAKKGNYDDSVSNVVGSNIFDITISMGLPLAIYLLITGKTINFVEHGSNLIDIRIFLLLITVIVLGIYYFAKSLKKKHVFILLFIYILFIIYSIGAAQYNAGINSVISNLAGFFIEWIRQPGGIEEILKHFGNVLTGNW